MAMNKNRIIELCLVFLISILSFSIGTFVGKKYSDNQHKLALLDPNYKHDLNTEAPTTEVLHGETAAGGSEAAHGEDAVAQKPAIANETPMSDADVAKMNAEMTEDEDAADANTVKTINEDGTTAENPKGAKAKKPAAETVAATKRNNNENIVREVANISAKAKTITQDEKGLDGKTQYTVQIGSFPTPTEADKVVTSLQARGYKATQSEATVNGKTWYRVQVGLFGSLQDAQTYKKELVEQNHLSSAMILRVNK